MRPLVLPLLLLGVSNAFAQAPVKDMHIVLPDGPGSIVVPLDGDMHYKTLKLYNDNPSGRPLYRPSLLLTDELQTTYVSYILFVNDTTSPTSEGCRDAVMKPILAAANKRGQVANVQQTSHITADGRKLTTASYFQSEFEKHPVHQQNLYAFTGDSHNCAYVHVSKVEYKSADDTHFNAILDRFTYTPDFKPTSLDYGSMATALFDTAHDPKSAAPYYESALATLPQSGIGNYDALTMRRVLTDQLAMSYGMSGDLKKSRALNEAAILKDPAYPLYYYNLACADAESGDATEARTHLQQAFDRRANTLKGEKLPDPTKDDSFLKLKSNKDFWKFVESLPKS